MATSPTAESWIKVEATGTDGEPVSKAIRFQPDQPIGQQVARIHEAFATVGVNLGPAEQYALFYEPFSPQNTLLLDFLQQQRRSGASASDSRSTASESLTSQSLWRQMAEAHQHDHTPSPPRAGASPQHDHTPSSDADAPASAPVSARTAGDRRSMGLSRGRSASLDMEELRAGGANTARHNGFWLDPSKTLNYYDLIPGVCTKRPHTHTHTQRERESACVRARVQRTDSVAVVGCRLKYFIDLNLKVFIHKHMLRITHSLTHSLTQVILINLVPTTG
jgi:hypothetical protein